MPAILAALPDRTAFAVSLQPRRPMRRSRPQVTAIVATSIRAFIVTSAWRTASRRHAICNGNLFLRHRVYVRSKTDP